MELATAMETVRRQHRAVLATRRSDGSPQMSPVMTSVDDRGRVLVSTRATAFKVRNIERDPTVWLCVLPDEFFGDWLQLRGRCEVITLPAAMDLLESYYRSVAGEHPDWDEYRRAMEKEQRVILRVTPDQAGPDRSG
ncbi:PPOX class F420-dependent oxidoreductase [Actinoalloteichus sp. AHMU CJ021]|uniref:PPOX class probable F420-dependent enzyme n=1 Tax=Actinoalloteichus caeruleus DSM 43889 TaxID=1120930 RepID=A0ABT1JK72_ACTCY|nr:PPOX class F420-dependent oxidoreductase [Actinoalloteichus caeruleus]AUS78732.1 PPOX class F420-dependent oxidoreductase [Actinoalloteichus sp. AHMU CJ021]MCP2332887.1 PPOX class probable F420-dependent enzyme [Actinoalloteichus caeruleus DSM 43889]